MYLFALMKKKKIRWFIAFRNWTILFFLNFQQKNESYKFLFLWFLLESFRSQNKENKKKEIQFIIYSKLIEIELNWNVL